MNRKRISAALREQVWQRAQGLCEYCLLHEDDAVHAFHVDHVISEKHGGPTEAHNLAFCCPFCNWAKGSDIAGIKGGITVRLFNPRIDHWADHFKIESVRIETRTHMGDVTAQLLGLNNPHRIALRHELIAAGLFPSEGARRLMA